MSITGLAEDDDDESLAEDDDDESLAIDDDDESLAEDDDDESLSERRQRRFRYRKPKKYTGGISGVKGGALRLPGGRQARIKFARKLVSKKEFDIAFMRVRKDIADQGKKISILDKQTRADNKKLKKKIEEGNMLSLMLPMIMGAGAGGVGGNQMLPLLLLMMMGPTKGGDMQQLMMMMVMMQMFQTPAGTTGGP